MCRVILLFVVEKFWELEFLEMQVAGARSTKNHHFIGFGAPLQGPLLCNARDRFPWVPIQPGSKMRVQRVVIREDIFFLYCRLQKSVGRGRHRWAAMDTDTKESCS